MYQYSTDTVSANSPHCPDIRLRNVRSISEMKENGWIFHVSHSDMQLYADRCGKNSWFGFYSGNSVGSVAAHFTGSGIASLTYGNCWMDNEVSVYLNLYKMSSAYGNETKKQISFNFTAGDTLRIVEDGAIIKLHNLTVSCDGMYTVG